MTIIKNDIDNLFYQNKLPVNMAKVNLKSFEQKRAEINICSNTIKLASDIFTKDLIAYAKSGGDMKNLTIKDVYKKNKNSSSLYWTSQKNCGMCVVDENKKDNDL